MRVLLAHNFYRSAAPSGEDVVYRAERSLLEAKGVEVIAFERSNDTIDDSTLAKRLRLARDTAWSKSTYAALSELIGRTRPDVAHFHNTFPLMSPSGYAACRHHGVPVVQTLHNFRLLCSNALLLRDGRPCEDCVGKSLWPALLHRCYRGSLSATAAVVWMLFSNRRRGTYQELVDRYVAPTRFAAGRLVGGGLPRGRVTVKPNFIPDPPPPGRGRGHYAVYVGRLTPEKGVRTLLDAWAIAAPLPLKVVGDGVLRSELEERARQQRLPVEFLGFRPRDEVLRIVSDAAFVVAPSQCYETFSMAVVEAYACGTPVVASRLGSLDEAVIEGETGLKFEASNPHDLAAKVRTLVANPARLGDMRRRARMVFEENYTAEKNYAALLAIYGQVAARRAPGERAAN